MEQAIEKHIKVYEAGTVLFDEGDVSDRLYIINEGYIRLTKRVFSEEVLIETLGPGEFCGELSLVNDGYLTVTATVVQNAKLIVVDTKQFESMLRANGELSMRLIKKLAGRLSEAQYRIAAMQMKCTIGRVMLQLRHEFDEAQGGKAFIPVDLADVISIDPVELEDVLNKLVAKKLITLGKDNSFNIPDEEEYARFLNYVELQDRYAYFEK